MNGWHRCQHTSHLGNGGLAVCVHEAEWAVHWPDSRGRPLPDAIYYCNQHYILAALAVGEKITPLGETPVTG